MGVVEYVKATQGEMRHVSWPNRRQVALYTAAVVAVSLSVAALLGLLDFGFLRGLRAVIGGGNTAPISTTTPTVDFAPQFELEEVPMEEGNGSGGTLEGGAGIDTRLEL
jgi:preprotein translocase SecE subunit